MRTSPKCAARYLGNLQIVAHSDDLALHNLQIAQIPRLLVTYRLQCCMKYMQLLISNSVASLMCATICQEQ